MHFAFYPTVYFRAKQGEPMKPEQRRLAESKIGLSRCQTVPNDEQTSVNSIDNIDE